jgi:hypothetical protein
MRWLSSLAIAALLLGARPAGAFSASDEARLANHETLVRPVSEGSFVGGLAYRVVDADSDLLSRIMRDPRYYRSLFARCESATLTRVDPSGRAHVRFVHALGPFRGGYTASIACKDKGTYCSFQIDKGEDNALEDGRGFIRLTRLADKQTLVTYGVLFDLGDGLTRTLFEARITKAALDFPRRLADAASR